MVFVVSKDGLRFKGRTYLADDPIGKTLLNRSAETRTFVTFCCLEGQ